MFTDKLVAKIPSTCTGIVKSIKFQPDDVCLVGHSLLEIEVADGDASAQPEKVEEKPNEPETPTQAATQAPQHNTAAPAKNNNAKALSTPAVRALSKKHNIDIN